MPPHNLGNNSEGCRGHHSGVTVAALFAPWLRDRLPPSDFLYIVEKCVFIAPKMIIFTFIRRPMFDPPTDSREEKPKIQEVPGSSLGANTS